MPDNVIKTLTELLNTEKWTRAALNSYSTNNFKELDTLIEQAENEEIKRSMKELCDEHLSHSKNSIIGLYLSGIISLSHHLVDDSNLIILINIFTDNHKWNIVEYLCLRMLEFGENKYALRTLSDCYINKSEDDKKYKIWERLIKVDYEEAEIVKLLAEKKEAENDLEGAISYYKKALYRFINKKLFNNVKAIWTKIVEYSPDDIDFFFNIEKKIANFISRDKAASLLETILPHFKQNENWNISIEILKRILDYDPKNFNYRKEIVDCYKQKFKNHSQLEEYIKISNLGQNWRNVHDSILDFEKHISFDINNYVFHRSWGIGKIANIKDDVFIIDFKDKKEHKMSLKMAVSALKNLINEHIWVLKSTMDKTVLKDKILNEIPWALKTIIKSYDNVANMKIIKAELVPAVLDAKEWTRWNTEARKIIKTDPYFGNLPDHLDQFEVRDKPISFEEKIYNKFKAEKNFFMRVQAMQDFLRNSELETDYFSEMVAYFTGFCRSYSTVSELTATSFLLTQKIIAVYPYLNPGIDYSFKELYNRIERPEDIFEKIANPEIKKEFLVSIKKTIEAWPEIYVKLFNLYQSKFIIDELVYNNQVSKIKEIFADTLNRYKEKREQFIWLVRNVSTEEWFKKLDFSVEKILICMVHLLDITYREISNKREVSLNRKLNNQIQDYLIKEQVLINFLMETDIDAITRIYTLVDDVKELNPSLKIQIRHKIKEKFPEFKFIGDQEIEVTKRGLVVTKKSYELKQKELRNILEIEVPNNSKEIGFAMAKGDLRENAEYKAALEKQELLKSACTKLQEELHNAQIFDESQVATDKVSFGTKVKMKNVSTGEMEEYTIMGPWESDPSRNIISYISPLGAEIVNHKPNDDLKFVINEKNYNYKIKSIEKGV